jgi:hypothetical protein
MLKKAGSLKISGPHTTAQPELHRTGRRQLATHAAALMGRRPLRVNTLLLTFSSMPVPGMIAVGLTPSNDGYVRTGGPAGTGLFVIASEYWARGIVDCWLGCRIQRFQWRRWFVRPIQPLVSVCRRQRRLRPRSRLRTRTRPGRSPGLRCARRSQPLRQALLGRLQPFLSTDNAYGAPLLHSNT